MPQTTSHKTGHFTGEKMKSRGDVMSINLEKRVFSPKEATFIIDQLKRAEETGYVESRTENSRYLLASFRGVEEKGITPKWNVKIYTYSHHKKGHSIVCVDTLVLAQLLKADDLAFIAPDLKVLRIDDAGWGFPLCGVMVGVCDEQNVKTAVVPVEYFRGDTPYPFETKRYLKEYAALAINLLSQFNALTKTHRIEICTGYVNQWLREELRQRGYDVRVVEIKGMLQEQLEARHRAYVHDEIGTDIYYDPKEIWPSTIPRKYFAALEYGKKHCPDKIKTGWRAIEIEDESASEISRHP